LSCRFSALRDVKTASSAVAEGTSLLSCKSIVAGALLGCRLHGCMENLNQFDSSLFSRVRTAYCTTFE
jgi:uncharacterized protein (DUF1810 family)